MIVFCCGMSRSAGTAHYQAVAQMVKMTKRGYGAGFVRKGTAAKAGWNELVVYKAEIYRPWMGELIQKNGAIALGIYRNFLDVFVSLMHFYSKRHKHKPGSKPDGSFESILNNMAPQVLEWQKNWEKHTDCWIRYEDTWNLGWQDAILEMADYIGLPITLKDAKTIEYHISKDQNMRIMNELRQEDRWIDSKNSLITRAHISPTGGAPGVWRMMLSSEQRDQIMELAGDWMEAHGYNTENR